MINKIIFFNKLKNKFYFLKDCLNNVIPTQNKENDIIFMISTNRSGSSLLSSLIRQHPELQSLSDEMINSTIKFDDKHTYGFAEDDIWKSLENYENNHYNYKNDGFLWGDPKYIGDFYRDDYTFKNSLKKEILEKIKSKKKIFIKHTFFTLRLKLIKKMFPNAKIIFNIRSYKDFIKSNNHKIKNSLYKEYDKKSLPDFGLHWLLINSIGMYHLKKYFNGSYFIFNHEKLYDDKYNNQNLFNELTDFLNIKRYEFSFNLVDMKYKFDKNINKDYEDIPYIAEQIADFENKIDEHKEK